MKGRLIIVFGLLLFSSQLFSQTKIYDVNANPVKQFEDALVKAKQENKHVILQIGGNWCSWCIKFHNFYKEDAELDSMVNANYVVINVNYNPKNDMTLFTKLKFPQRFGFPVLVVTDANGNLLHTQNSWYLEDGRTSYNRKKVKSFFKNWTVKALDPNSYKKNIK